MLEVADLKIEFGTRTPVRAVDGVDLAIDEGEILGLVGESGSGKTVLSLALLGLLGQGGIIRSGVVNWHGRNLLQLPERDLRTVRGREMSMIFQNPQASLNPSRPVGAQLQAVLRLHHQGMSSVAAQHESRRLMQEVGIPDVDRVLGNYPFELSPGMCQRVMIAMAISSKPRLLIADEPTASLDVTIQAQIMDLLLDLRDRLRMAILLVSHDLGVVARLCDRVAVMYLGRIVEQASAESLYGSPRHPYTQALLGSIPVPDPKKRGRMRPLKGDLPDPRKISAQACRFMGRCPRFEDRCAHTDPRLAAIDGHDGHSAACIRTDVVH